VHHLQGKAARVIPPGLREPLQDFYRDKRDLLVRHRAGARRIGQGSVNNAYQQLIARDEAHLQWIADAIGTTGGQVPEASQTLLDPDAGPGAWGGDAILADDTERQMAFVERWRERVVLVRAWRVRRMLELILGEMLEQLRVFEPRPDAGAGGRVLPARGFD
jgi:hypothetical protein